MLKKLINKLIITSFSSGLLWAIKIVIATKSGNKYTIQKEVSNYININIKGGDKSLKNLETNENGINVLKLMGCWETKNISDRKVYSNQCIY